MLTHNIPNAVYKRIETLFIFINPAKYRLENINKTVILASRQYLVMNGIETINLLRPPCAYCQRKGLHMVILERSSEIVTMLTAKSCHQCRKDKANI